MARRPPGYWDQWENVESTLRAMIEELGRFPTYPEISAKGLTSMVTAIRRTHGGMPSVRERLGCGRAKRPDGYYKDFENIRREMEGAKRKLGHYPSAPEMRTLGLTTLADGMRRYHGGLRAVQARLGAKQRKARNGVLSDWNYVRGKLEEARKQLGHFPTTPELNELGMSSIGVAISRHHGGMDTVRALMEEESGQKPHGYWNDWDNVERELRALMKALGRFPTHQDLLDRNLTTLFASMQRNFGGIPECRRRMGIAGGRKPNGWYHDWGHVEESLRPVIDELGRFPTGAELRARGHSDLVGAIERVHGGIRSVTKKMGFTSSKRPDGYWKVWENVERELLALYGTLGRPPVKGDLEAVRLGTMAHHISGHYGGWKAVRARIGWTPVDQSVLDQYADDIMMSYMTHADEYDSFDAYVEHLTTTCKVERELRIALGLSPTQEIAA